MPDLTEKCAIFGVYGKGLEASRLSFYGLFSLQHRGQESSGISTSDGTMIRTFKGTGLVTHVYSEDDIQKLPGHMAIGHNRYSTSKDTGLLHAQPVEMISGSNGSAKTLLTLAHNGNLPSVTALVRFLRDKGVDTTELNDSELMARTIMWFMQNGATLKEAIVTAYPLFTGAFSLLVMTKDEIAAVRDEKGIRPLAMGKLNGGYVFASETCAFQTVGATYIRDVAPGELVIVNDQGLESTQIKPGDQKLDIFEFVYFARPDSELLGKSVYQVRHNFGWQLARETHIAADIVVPVPETAIPVAIGYSKATGIPLEMALVKNRYIHRTFIEPEQHTRDLGVKLKLTPLPDQLRGKRVILIDDSIVRGTTSRQIVRALKEAGAIEVHFLASSPPIKFPDFYGINTPKQESLIASHMSNDEIRQYIEADSLHYLSLQGMLQATEIDQNLFSLSCFTGSYPIDLKERTAEIGPPKTPPETIAPTLNL